MTMTIKRSREAIAVSTEVKEGLSLVNNLLEEQLGSRLSYNEIIAFLLLQYNKSDSADQLDLFTDRTADREWADKGERLLSQSKLTADNGLDDVGAAY
tara:strand:+ start:528 stop:821 length:294 start_codon:yes stop_codon:yes gene_type:complete